MSTQSEITRLQSARDTIRAKAVELGIGLTTDKLDALATKIEANLINRGAVQANVKEGETYTIPKGYHNGSGVVAGIAGGGSYTLQAKEVTPTKSQQEVTSDSGYYGLSSVTVKAIPSQYQDVSGTTAAAGDVLANKVFTAADGTLVTGTLANNTATTETLSTTKTSYTIPAGKHSGSGKVQIVLEEKTATPTKEAQNITPTAGKVLSKVTVNAIASNYVDVNEVHAEASQVLDGVSFASTTVGSGPGVYTGTMTNNGAVSDTLSFAGHQAYTIPEGYHDGKGSVKILLEEIKNITPSTTAQSASPAVGKVLSVVTVDPIPSQYVDASNTNALASEIIAGAKAVSYDEATETYKEIEGTMVDFSKDGFTKKLTVSDTTCALEAGYYDSTCEVYIETETKSATPTTSSQTISPTTGKVLSQVTVGAIPDKYKDSTNVDATAANILTGKKAIGVTAQGGKGEITGSMANNGAVALTMDGLTTTSVTVPAGYHSGSGTVSLTNDIETALAAI